jgi:yeast amino acid transporter
MIAYLPIPGGHITLAERFVDRSFSFAMGWNYWYDICVSRFCLQLKDIILHSLRYNWVIVLPAELSAASILISFWNTTISGAVWITICMVVVIAINLMGAGERFYLIQNRVSGSSLPSLRRLWRG